MELLVSTLSQQHDKLKQPRHGGGVGLRRGISWLPWELSFVLEPYSVGEPGRAGNMFEGEWWRLERKHWTLGTMTILFTEEPEAAVTPGIRLLFIPGRKGKRHQKRTLETSNFLSHDELRYCEERYQKDWNNMPDDLLKQRLPWLPGLVGSCRCGDLFEQVHTKLPAIVDI